MVYADRKRPVRRARVYRSVAEKRRIVELTFEPGASVSLVAQAEGVNSHQVFDWRRAYRNGKLAAGVQESCKLLPVIVSAADAEIDAEGTAEAGCGAAGRCGLLHHRHTYRQQQARSTLNCPAGRRSGSRTAQMRRCCEL
jgi:transposase